MKKKMKIAALFCLVFIGVLGLKAKIVVNASAVTPVEKIYKMQECVADKNWDNYIELMCDSRKLDMENYFYNDNQIYGIKQLNSFNILSIVEIPEDLADAEWCTEEYSILDSGLEKKTYIVSAYCNTDIENEFFYNGINYFLLVFIQENENWGLVQFNIPSYNLLKDVGSEKFVDENSSYYKEELRAIKALEMRLHGFLVNSELSPIEDGIEVIGNEYDLMSDSYKKLGYYSNYSYPTSIRVKITSSNTIVTVNFDDYMKNVLPNEWMGSWNSEALKAGALCVKMVGWYSKISPVGVVEGYDLSTGTQKYIANTEQASTNSAIDSTYEYGMANSSGYIFFPRYAAGISGQAGPKGGGQLKQWGSQYLAKQGYDYKQILNYYYSGSDDSTGDVIIYDRYSY